MNRRLYLRLVVLVLLSGLTLSLSNAASLVYAQDAGQYHEVLFSIPVGDEGIHYAGTEHPDMLIWGPSAFTIAPDGNFWIADTAGNQLLRYDSKGIILERINIENLIVGAGDIEVNSKGIWVLDEASQPPKIVHIPLNGKKPTNYELPKGLWLEDGLSGIALGEGNQILIEREGGSKLTRFLTSNGKVDPQPIEGYLYGGKLYKAQPADLKSGTTSHGLITAGDTRIEVAVANELGGLRILGRHADDSIFVIAEEMIVDAAPSVDQTVRHYSSSGELLGMARISLPDQYTTVSHGLTIGPDGAVYMLITKPDHAEVQRLRFSQTLDPILPARAVINAKDNIVSAENASLICVTRNAIINAAAGYKGNYRYLNNTNINGSCANRIKPRYLGSAGNYYSVSYDWGGFDTVSAWNNFMANNYQAGDIETSGQTGEGCSKGVDCSGFVSRVWGVSGRYGTCELVNISTQLSGTSQLQKGDIMNKCGVHTILFDSVSANGMWGYESTTYNNYDRVVYIYRSWSSVSTYVPRKYNNVCP